MNFCCQYLRSAAALMLGALLAVALMAQLRAWRGGASLRVEWDGFGGALNYRDVGASINDCLGDLDEPSLLKEGRIGRSNHKYSGFSCGRVGNPEVIYSLNFDPSRRDEYFCVADQGPVVGRHFNESVVLNDLEFMATWDDARQRDDACGFFRDSFVAIAAGKKVLVHCEAGRDRTGTYAALIAALVAERAGRLDDGMLAAIECDYRKTASLKPHKYGRMENFIEELRQSGGIAAFFSRTCGIEAELNRQVADGLMLH